MPTISVAEGKSETMRIENPHGWTHDAHTCSFASLSTSGVYSFQPSGAGRLQTGCRAVRRSMERGGAFGQPSFALVPSKPSAPWWLVAICSARPYNGHH